MHRITAIIFTLFVLVTAGYAQIPSGNAYIGYSYMSADLLSSDRTNMNGWNGSLEGKVLPFIGIVADFSGNYGTAGIPPNSLCNGIVSGSCSGLSANTNIYSYLFGPRVSVTVGKVRPFADALFGAGHITESASGFPTRTRRLLTRSVAASTITSSLSSAGDWRAICCKLVFSATRRIMCESQPGL